MVAPLFLLRENWSFDSGKNNDVVCAHVSRHLWGKFLILQKKGETMTVKTFTAVLHRDEDMYVADCPELGTVSQGSTMEEALTNLKEATELYLEEFPL